jgi:antitoxin component HigA of HigAB toxin-antitoxin module
LKFFIWELLDWKITKNNHLRENYLILISNGYLYDSLELIRNLTELMPIRFKKEIMNIKLIKTEADYKAALRKLEKIFDAPASTAESDEADLLGLMIDEYEKKHYPIEVPDPIEAIKIRMEEMQLKQVDLVEAIGGKSRV